MRKTQQMPEKFVAYDPIYRDNEMVRRLCLEAICLSMAEIKRNIIEVDVTDESVRHDCECMVILAEAFEKVMRA